VNYEGRAQRFFRVSAAPGDVRASWQWLRDIMRVQGRPEGQTWTNIDRVAAALAEALPVFKPLPEVAPSADFRLVGQKIPRQPQRYSGRTAMYANREVSEPQPPADDDSPLAFSMEGFEGQPPPALMARFWAPGWNSVQAVTKFQEEISGPLRGGDSGRRLIQADHNAKPIFFGDLPQAFEPRAGQWLLAPLHHIFGSEELSALAAGIAQLSPSPYVAIHPQDAEQFPVGEGEQLELDVDGQKWRLPLRHLPSLPRGVAGLPVGLPGAPRIELPQWAKLTKPAVP
jgi:NADH-quinone oxidoreductase subunit G